MLVQEAYYGQLPEFETMEKLFNTIIEKAKKEGTKCNPNKYPEMKTVLKLFCKVFGFKKSLIYWEPFDSMDNAYTYSLNAFIVFSDKKKFIEKRSNGFYDSSNSIILTLFISTGLIFSDLTAREIIAIILHEIGHNFDYSNYHKFNAIMACVLSFGMDAFTIHENKNKTNDIKERVTRDKTKEDDKIYGDQKRRDRMNRAYKKHVGDYFKNRAIKDFIFMPINTVCNLVNFVFSPFFNVLQLAGKKSEIFSDSFATAYGYGSELVSSLEKISAPQKYYDPKSPVMRFFMDLSNLQSEITTSLLDVHGTNQERCYECLKKLKHDLKTNDFNPELKEELEKEIESMNAMYKEFFKFKPNERLVITKIARRICSIVFRNAPNIQKLFPTHKV